MSSIQMVNSVIEWERRIEFEEAKRITHSYEPYVNYLAEPEPARKQKTSLIDRILSIGKKHQPVMTSRKEKPCKDPQPC
jgi:hypothetical protein